ncbi:MAG: hypothetical protein Q8903_05770 [Bacteroidota bacterium]|nr:hypothetical protein [Bacteroidota bacterium]
MIYKKYFPAVVSGFVAAVVTVIPIFKSCGCCVIIPAASVLALWFLLKINKNQFTLEELLSVKTCLLMGLYTGIAAAIFSTAFDTVMTYFTRTNDFIEALPLTEQYIKDNKLEVMLKEPLDLLKYLADQIRRYGFSAAYLFMSLCGNLVIFAVTGMVGGLIGKWFISNKLKRN